MMKKRHKRGGAWGYGLGALGELLLGFEETKRRSLSGSMQMSSYSDGLTSIIVLSRFFFLQN